MASPPSIAHPAPTLKTIAQLAGVSPITASRALRGDPRHSEETRERVRRIAEEAGYRVNPLVAALMSTRARKFGSAGAPNLAVLNLGPSPAEVKNEPSLFGSDLYQHARNQGYAIEEFTYDPPEMSADRLRRIFISRGIRGIILMPAPRAPFQFDFDFEGFAAVAIGHSITHRHLPRITSHPYLRTLEAIQQLADRGYRRLALVNTQDFDRRFNYRMSAAALAAPLAITPKVRVLRHNLDMKVDFAAIKPALQRELCNWLRTNRVDAVISNLTDVYNTIRNGAIMVPEEMAYVHLDRHALPEVSCMDQMLSLIGKKAVDLVIAMINRNEFRLPEYPSVLVTPSIWREGMTAPMRMKG
jgi:LacI family transcriptional regulator